MTENDSELIAVWISDRIRQGDSKAEALQRSVGAIDGVFTYLIADRAGIGFAKDRFAAKPLVAMGTEPEIAVATEEQAVRRIYREEGDVLNFDGPSLTETWMIAGGRRVSELLVVAGVRPIREVNRDIRTALADGSDVRVRDCRSRHNLGVGLPAGASVRFEGSVGYYCGGLNDGANLVIERNAGWGAGEAMAGGVIDIGGYAGMSAGASMRGGLIHVRGDAGPRCGVAMKGGDILVEGRIGFLAGFMSHAGRIIALEGAEEACGDSLWGGEVWLGGPAKSLGVDAEIVEPEPGEAAEIEALLASRGINGEGRDWRKIVSGQKLWHFESRDAKAWLMI